MTAYHESDKGLLHQVGADAQAPQQNREAIHSTMNGTDENNDVKGINDGSRGSGSPASDKTLGGHGSNHDEEHAGKSMGELFPDLGPEAPVISGVAHDRSESLVTVRGVPDVPGKAAQVFTELADSDVNIDMIVQAGASTGTADISFTVPESTMKRVRTVLESKRDEFGYTSFDIDANVGKVAVVGVGMKTHSGLAAKFFKALSEQNINVLMISTSEIRIAALVSLDELDDAVRALHTAYGLDADQVEAVVYGGSGR